MGHKHTKAQILEGALAAAFEDGLSQLTFGRIAKRLGISDRIVVYYFPTKDELITAVVSAMGLRLQETLSRAFTSPAKDYLELLRTVWPVVAHSDADPVFALFFEANGLATAGRTPYHSLVPALVEAWIDWASGFIEGPPTHRRLEAETSIAIIDGLLLLRLLSGPEAADRVAHRLGIC